MTTEAVVVGGGVAGLASALLLAHHGCRVTLVEQAPRVAPVLRGFSRWGVAFDTGFHYAGGLGEGQSLDLLLRGLGLRRYLRPRPLDPEGFDRYECAADGFAFAMPCGYERARERLVEAFPAEAAAVDAYLGEVRETCRHLPYVSLEASLGMEALEDRRWLTLEEFLERHRASPRLRAVLSFHCFLHGAAPDEVPFVTHASVVGPYFESAHGFVGGGRSVAEAFERELAAQGVRVLCGRAARHVLLSASGCVEGVELDDGERLAAGVCIAAIHPRAALPLVPAGAFRPAFTRRVEDLEETPSAYLLFGAAQGGLGDLAGSNRYYFPRPASRGWVAAGTEPLAERPLYVTAAWRESGGGESVAGLVAMCPALPAETAAWEGSTAGRRPADYLAFKAEAQEKVRGVLERCWPEAAGRVTGWGLATPLSLRHWAGSPFGSLYGVKHKVGQHNPGAATRVEGFLLAGQATAAPGLMGAVVSAYLACGSILGHDRLREAVRRAA